ncbi:putative ATP-dependent RNA helicase TDRD12 isoform X2 [Portunus trituberculatus]|nr:putative ATP-dependent RNA helicase TDRD12 isoform X2 [Portunus trituberculatus]
MFDIEEIDSLSSETLVTSSVRKCQQPSGQSELSCIEPSLSQDSKMKTTPANTVMFRSSEEVQIKFACGSSASNDVKEIIPQYLQYSGLKKCLENCISEDTCSVLWKSPKHSHDSSIPNWFTRDKDANMLDTMESCSSVSGSNAQHATCLWDAFVPEQLENDVPVISQEHLCSSPYVDKVSGIQSKLQKEMTAPNYESVTHLCGSLNDTSDIDPIYCEADSSKSFCMEEHEQLTSTSRSSCKGYTGSSDIFIDPPMKSLEFMKEYDNFAHINVKSVGVFPVQEPYISQPLDEEEMPTKNVRSISELCVINEKNSLDKNQVGRSHINTRIVLDNEGLGINQCTSVLNEGLCSISTQKYEESEAPNIAKLYRVFVAGEQCILDEEVMINKEMMHSVLNSCIVNVLQEKRLKATRLQAYTWPVIAKGNSVVIVGEKNCGKTMGYVVPLLSNVLDSWKLISERLSPGIGPVMVVVCSTWRNVKRVADYIVSLLPVGISFKIMTAWGGCGTEEEVSTGRQLLSGCDILLTTAPYLLRLLMGRQQGAATTLKRCCHLVFDDAEVILQNFSLEVKSILTIWGEERRKCGRPDLDLQAVLVSSRWTELLYQLTEILFPLLDPLVVISAPCEAAIATRVASHIHIVSNESEALSLVMKLIHASYVYKRKMVFVSNDASAELLESFMNNAGMSCAIASSTTHMWKVQQLVHKWHIMQNMTLIVSHGAEITLLRHDLTNAEVLFHTHLGFSLTTFSYRYSFMFANFVTDLSKKSSNCESHVILSEFTLEKLPGVQEELYRICGFPKATKATAALVCYRNNTKYMALCYYLKAYGRCNRPVCGFRHEVQMLDIPQNIPRSGEVTFKVINTLSASRYLVHIMQYREQAKSQCVDLSNSYSVLQIALQNHFTSRAHCEFLRSAEPGMLCAVQDEGIWTRAQIVSVNRKESATLINAFLVDEGKQVTINLESVLVLPSYLAAVPHLAVEVLLCHVQPMDLDTDWTLQASTFVYNIFAKRKDSKFIGRIVLALGSTLWLNPVAEFIKIDKKFVQKKTLREKLISEKFGVDNPAHMKNLHHLCAKAGVSLETEAVCGQAWRKNLTEALETLQNES